MSISVRDDLYRFNDWANERLLKLCRTLSDSQLDTRRELGTGSLRNTVFHILAAEEIWLERWTCTPWRAFEADAGNTTLNEIQERLAAVSEKRRRFFASQDGLNSWSDAMCRYVDAKGNQHQNRLEELVIHVANHAIHHRAQALSYLKAFGVTVPGGLDYLFFRIAFPAFEQESETATMLRHWGLEVQTGRSPELAWEPDRIRKYFAYGDWANDRILSLVQAVDPAALDRDFGMGPGSLRKTVLHMLDAERWWIRNWTTGPSVFDKLSVETPLSDVPGLWQQVRDERTQFMQTLDSSGAARVVTALTGQASLRFSIAESMLQLCGHGTHHRAQLLNMLRHSGCQLVPMDYVVWIRETGN